MTDSDDGWIRRWVAGRRREESPGQDAEMHALTAGPQDISARLEQAIVQNTQLAEVNARQAHRLRQLEALLERGAKDDPQQLQELTVALQTGQRSLRAARSAAERASARAVELEQRLAGVERDAEHQRPRAETMEAAYSGLQTQLGPLREQTRRVRKQLQFQQEQFVAERNVRKATEGKLERATAQATDLQQQLAAAHEELAAHRSRSRNAQSEVSTLKSQSASLLSELADASAQLHTAQTRRTQTLEYIFGASGTELVETLLSHTAPLDEGSH